MKKISYLSAVAGMLAATAIVVTSCMDEMEGYEPAPRLAPRLSVAEARLFFEQYAAENATEAELPGMAPGNFAPQWDKAVAASLTKDSYVDVPIVAERYYTADFAKESTPTGLLNPGRYTTAVAQKLVVGKNLETGAVSCAVVTIIPAEKAATKSHERVQNMHIHGRTNSGFSGAVVYSSVVSNSTLAVDRYVNGRIAARGTIYNSRKSYEENLADMKALVRQVGAKARITTKSWWSDMWENFWGGGGGGGGGSSSGGNGNGSGSDGGDDTYDGGTIEDVIIIGTRPDPDPEPEPPFELPSTDDSDNSNDSGEDNSNSSGGSNSNGNTTPPSFTPSTVAPKAAKIFKSSTLSEQNWRDLERMITEIQKDCMGGKLYNALPSNSSININYSPSLQNSAGQYDHNSTTITVRSLNGYSDVLFHELLHSYQMTGHSNTDNKNNLMNYEVETHALQYLFAIKNYDAYKSNKRLQAKYKRSGLGKKIDILLSNMDSKGNLMTRSSDFNEDCIDVANGLRAMGYDAGKYPYNPGHSSQSLFQNIMSDC